MKKSVLIFVFLYLLFHNAFSQNTDSCGLKISLLTCSPGEELYSIFGHSAIRVQEPASNTDIIFNYGTFDFEDPGFYVKFVRGKLLYFVSIERFENFYYSYQYENRSIIEQTLNLSCEEKTRLFSALKTNLLEENKYYLYDFLFDNCSTRLRDIVARNTSDSLSFRRIIPDKPPTFRNLIHEYLRNGGQYWSKLGIDLLLGSRIDVPVSSAQAMFLPDYLMKGFDSAFQQNKPLVSSKRTILPADETTRTKTGWFRPFVATMILLIVFGSLQFIYRPRPQAILDVFDVAFFLILGLIGVLILFMWLGTDHRLCRDNFNLLWALPTHLVAAFFIHSSRKWVVFYFRLMSIWYFILFFGWALIPQEMNSAFVPLVVLAFIRSYVRFRKTHAKQKRTISGTSS